METWFWIVGALLLGAILGAGGAVAVARRRMGDRESVSRLRREFEGYRQEVGEHFVQTAELVNDLTRSYKAVYDHLEQGAYRLVGEETLRRRLEHVEAEPVRLEYIGRRDRALVLGSDSARSGERGPEATEGPSTGPSAGVDGEPSTEPAPPPEASESEREDSVATPPAEESGEPAAPEPARRPTGPREGSGTGE